MSYSPKKEIQLKVDLICDLMKNNSSLTGDKNESLKHMVNEIPVNSYSTDNIPVFIYSIYYNYCNIFEILLSRGVDINLPYNKLNKSTLIRHLEDIYLGSFVGNCGDFQTDSNVLSFNNLEKLQNSFNSIIKSINK